MVFVADDKIKFSSKDQNLETCISPCELDRFPIAKDFSGQNDGKINKGAFCDII